MDFPKWSKSSRFVFITCGWHCARLGEFFGVGAEHSRTMTCKQLVKYHSDPIDNDLHHPELAKIPVA